MIKRYYINKDNHITNRFKGDLVVRATGSNFGESDVLEVNSIYGQASTSSLEETRILLDYPKSSITSDRLVKDIPLSGSVSFYLKMFNVEHSDTLPKKFNLEVYQISSSWDEGTGKDTITFEDTGSSNWINKSSGEAWVSEGGDYLDTISSTYYFETGYEDLEVDITDLIENQILNTSYGLLIKLGTQELESSSSYFNKKFLARDSEYILKRPYIEARWETEYKDDRNNFYASSSLIDSSDNLFNLFFYSKVRGVLKNVPTAGSVVVNLYEELGGSSIGSFNTTTLKDGIYTASVYADTTASTIYDVWGDGTTEFYTGTISVNQFSFDNDTEDNDYWFNIKNVQRTYKKESTEDFRVYARPKYWSPTIYSIANSTIENTIIENLYYKIERVVDGFEVIPYGTGSLQHTKTSYDNAGNYFEVDFRDFEAGYDYEISLLYYTSGRYKEAEEKFKFKVIE